MDFKSNYKSLHSYCKTCINYDSILTEEICLHAETTAEEKSLQDNIVKNHYCLFYRKNNTHRDQ